MGKSKSFKPEAIEWIKTTVATQKETQNRWGISAATAYYWRKEAGIELAAGWHRLTNKDTRNATAVCKQCGPTELVWVGHRKKWVCKESSSGEDRRVGAHGLTKAEAQRFREGKSCDICGAKERLAVDHCHVTGVVRGVLCMRHNVGLGTFEDNVTELLTAIEYLRKHRE